MRGLRAVHSAFFEHTGEGEGVHQEQFGEGENVAGVGFAESDTMGCLVAEDSDFVCPDGHVFRQPFLHCQAVDDFIKVVSRPLSKGDLDCLSAHGSTGIPVFSSQVVRCLDVEPPDVCGEVFRRRNRFRLWINIDNPVIGVQLKSGGVSVWGRGSSLIHLYQCSDPLMAIPTGKKDGEETSSFLSRDRMFGYGFGSDIFLEAMGA